MTKARKTMNKSEPEEGIAIRAAEVPCSPVATRGKIHNGSHEPDQTKAPRPTKSALLRAMLAAPGGASLPALMAATGWQAHTLRAALTGLRKAGHDVTRHRAGEATGYAIGPDGPEGACTGVTVGDTAEGEVDAALAATPVRASA
ncbi:DUF3489 domain-containing protein [Neotabrizicola sp. sgz301269]|uniref:DUF3489 domain-containing protein n=1 Tax=Neotabrizicola sp. sgz301269 TaxID=3276282 RepID=UPI00376FE771